VQTCVVHLIRHSLAFVSYKDRKAVAAALKQIYKAKDADAGCTKWTPQGVKAELEGFSEGPWGKKYPAIAQSWRRNWSQVIPFFAFPGEVRRIIYTTDEIDKPVFACRDIFFQHGRPRGEEPGTRMQARPRRLIVAPPLRRPCTRLSAGAAASD
jgi:putative transposase